MLFFLPRFSQTIASSLKRNDLRILQEPVENGPGCRDVSDQFSPIFNWPITGHHGGTQFVSPHDNLEEVFSGSCRQTFQSHIINNQQITFQIFRHDRILLARIGKLKIMDQIENGTVNDTQSLIVDNLRVHHAKLLQSWLDEQWKKNKFKLFYLPSYSPELNPDEYLNRDVKAHLLETKISKTADELTETVRLHLTKKDKASIKRLFHKPEVRYAAEEP